MTGLWQRYERAERFCEWNVRARVRNVTVTPHWLADGTSFWFDHEEPGSTTVRVVDPVAATLRTTDGPPAERDATPGGVLRSPDGHNELITVGSDIAVRPAGGGPARRLTHDGTPLYAYAGGAQSSTMWISNRRSGMHPPPVAAWSPDSRRILTHRLDQRGVPDLHLLDSRPASGHRPQLYSYRMPFTGDPLARAELVVIDTETGRSVTIDHEPLLVEWASPLEIEWVWWDEDGARVWFLAEDRGAFALRVCVADARTGAVTVVVEDRSDSYVEPHPLLPWPRQAQRVPGREQLAWISKRSGWRHIEIVDIDRGRRRALTDGEWVVRELLDVGAAHIIFSACGREPGRDPYFRHVYRIGIDGGSPTLLTPEDADHACVVFPSGRHLLDTASTMSVAPTTRVRRTDGDEVLTVARADLSALKADGWIPPEPFSVPAPDGTPLFGCIYRPADFDPGRSYPVIDAYYPGPQLIRTPKSFTVDDNAGVDAWPGPWGAQALAELGFVVVNVDGRGTPLRGRALHRASYGRLQDYALDDHIAAITALAATRPWMDLTRGVGVQGHSAGAAAAVRALLTRPAFYTVGVAGSGVHDLRRYIAYWGEKYQGLLDSGAYEGQSNLDLADRLEGKLLLMHGELDDNVHPSNTLSLFDAFVQADIDVDLVLLSGWGHPCWTHPHYVRRMWDFFVRHLAGETPPRGYRVTTSPAAQFPGAWDPES